MSEASVGQIAFDDVVANAEHSFVPVGTIASWVRRLCEKTQRSFVIIEGFESSEQPLYRRRTSLIVAPSVCPSFKSSARIVTISR